MFDFEGCIRGLEELCRGRENMTFSQELELEMKLAAHFGKISELYYKIDKNMFPVGVLVLVETDGKELYWDTVRQLVRCDTSEIAISKALASAIVRVFSDTDDLCE